MLSPPCHALQTGQWGVSASALESLACAESIHSELGLGVGVATVGVGTGSIACAESIASQHLRCTRWPQTRAPGG